LILTRNLKVRYTTSWMSELLPTDLILPLLSSTSLGKILHSQVIGPLHRGLSHNPERFAAKGVRPETPYPGLFVGGSDLTVGESFNGSIVGGWLAANAVMGYNAIDYLFLQKSITADIVRYLESPDTPDKEDVAVPYETPSEGTVEETLVTASKED
jgi:hypothetical protein